ncbi:alpha/beta hydrolase [Vibrio cortegadensis]|uniref:alpha/beta hydrolase n=1 Tax=Vibrio cortegadensis TaxID=1328770 RepID=UPI0021C2A412|nr:alpha/beta hydrolase [Vibrio cortegadensis]MDN3698368.1 alpha/beta hydrolase [Vibrio cortegadensis]
MLFITNRIPLQSARSKVGRHIGFNYQNTDVSKWLYFCERYGENDYTEVTSQPFFSRLKSLPTGTQLLFYIHGFDNNMEPDIFRRAQQLQHLLDEQMDSQKRARVLVIPLIWPCDDDSKLHIVDDYWDDQKAADYSGIAFARLLCKFDDWRRAGEQQTEPCLRRMNLLAHSMGNRILVNALQSWVEELGLGAMPMMFRNIFMIAADVENHILDPEHRGRYVLDAAKNTVVYYASDDLAMSASKVANLRHITCSRRLGMTGLESISKLSAKRVFEFDCDSFNNRLDPPLGHSYFLTNQSGEVSPIIPHIAKAIETGCVSLNWLAND